MASTTWIVQRGLTTSGAPGPLPFRFATALDDLLTVGPQDPDARVEQRLRRAAGMPSDFDLLDEHERHLADDVVLLVQPELSSVLAALWWIDAMSQRRADLGRVRLGEARGLPRVTDAIEAVRQATPIGDDLEPLRALRRAVVEDSDAITLPLDAISEPRRSWAAVTTRISDLLPDARGLDRIDALLLDHTGTEWTPAALLIAHAMRAADREHRIGDLTMFERLFVLAEHRPAAHWRDARDGDEHTALVELDLEGTIAIRFARARLTPFGARVLAGRDALEVRAFDRWLGGRFLTRDRILRTGLRRG